MHPCVLESSTPCIPTNGSTLQAQLMHILQFQNSLCRLRVLLNWKIGEKTWKQRERNIFLLKFDSIQRRAREVRLTRLLTHPNDPNVRTKGAVAAIQNNQFEWWSALAGYKVVRCEVTSFVNAISFVCLCYKYTQLIQLQLRSDAIKQHNSAHIMIVNVIQNIGAYCVMCTRWSKIIMIYTSKLLTQRRMQRGMRAFRVLLKHLILIESCIAIQSSFNGNRLRRRKRYIIVCENNDRPIHALIIYLFFAYRIHLRHFLLSCIPLSMLLLLLLIN